MMGNVRGATFIFTLWPLFETFSLARVLFLVLRRRRRLVRELVPSLLLARGGLLVRRTSERSIILNRTFAVRPKHRSYFRPDLKPIRDAAFTRVARVDLSAGTFSTSFFSFFLFARDLPRAARCFVVSSSEPWSAC